MKRWNQTMIAEYQAFTRGYISTYTSKIDCADLAIASLVDFADVNKLPVRLKFYGGKQWKYYEFNPGKDNPKKFKQKAMRMLGALNVIDNTVEVPLSLTKPGDLIMSRWSGTSGHTRIIYSLRKDQAEADYWIVWYQGNLPIVIPQKKQNYFKQINGVFGNKPRRWNFAQFNK